MIFIKNTSIYGTFTCRHLMQALTRQHKVLGKQHQQQQQLNDVARNRGV